MFFSMMTAGCLALSAAPPKTRIMTVQGPEAIKKRLIADLNAVPLEQFAKAMPVITHEQNKKRVDQASIAYALDPIFKTLAKSMTAECRHTDCTVDYEEQPNPEYDEFLELDKQIEARKHAELVRDHHYNQVALKTHIKLKDEAVEALRSAEAKAARLQELQAVQVPQRKPNLALSVAMSVAMSVAIFAAFAGATFAYAEVLTHLFTSFSFSDVLARCTHFATTFSFPDAIASFTHLLTASCLSWYHTCTAATGICAAKARALSGFLYAFGAARVSAAYSKVATVANVVK